MDDSVHAPGPHRDHFVRRLRDGHRPRPRTGAGTGEGRHPRHQHFPEILANALNVSFLARYLRRDFGERTIARYGRATDTRPRRVVQLGAYQGPLPTVAEGDLYLPLGPLEEATTTFNMSKKGGTQDLFIEVFVNDNVQFLQHVVEAMADLARVTLATAVWQPWVSNANAPDGVPWFDATHNNVQTGALTEANVVAAITKLSAQTPPGSTTVLPSPAQVGRVILMVPPRHGTSPGS
jgi:hypothetical protein